MRIWAPQARGTVQALLFQSPSLARTVFPTKPPTVEYRLTELGESFLEPMRGLVDWAETHRDEIRAARKEFDAGPV